VRWQTTARERPGMKAAPATLAGVRHLLRALRQGETVGLLPDQVPPLGQGVWAPFFGRDAYTMTLAARLAQQSGATVLMLWCERRAYGAGFIYHLREPAEPLPALAADAGGAQAAAVINRAVESLVRECPSQYLWGYNRYKSPRTPAAIHREAAA
jgi:Kdo2-lipid IVA lauroyltransferase/acyltransferase